MSNWIWCVDGTTYRLQCEQKGDRKVASTMRKMTAAGWMLVGEGWTPDGTTILLFDRRFTSVGAAKAWLKHDGTSPPAWLQ